MVQSSETSLASIGRSLQKIASIMETLNENLVAFAKQQEKPEVVELCDLTAEQAYNKRLAERVEGYAAGMPGIDPLRNAVAHTSEFNNPEHRVWQRPEKEGE